MSYTGRYHLISIGGVWITSTGLNTGSPCASEVTGLAALDSPYAGNTIPALDGTPINQIIENSGRGAALSIRVLTMMADVYGSLRAVINGAIAANTSIPVTIAGPTGSYSFNAVPTFPTPFTFAPRFVDDTMFDVTINLTVT